MPRPCTVCTHAERSEIDRALVEGATYRTVADRFGLSETALKRHRKDHMPVALAKAAEAEQIADSGDLMEQVRSINARALGILDKAEQAGELRTALAAIREARGCLELLLEVEGELTRRNVVNIVMSPEWLEVRGVLMVALHDYPDARIAVASALASLEEGNPS